VDSYFTPLRNGGQLQVSGQHRDAPFSNKERHDDNPETVSNEEGLEGTIGELSMKLMKLGHPAVRGSGRRLMLGAALVAVALDIPVAPTLQRGD
jgi:hypothetical protein